jgi:signal transduction histidine kinase
LRRAEHLESLMNEMEEADRRKNQFIATVFHELRNPLTPIRNSLYLLDRAPAGSEKAKRALSIITRQVEHMARLFDDLLDLSRVAEGRMPFLPVRFDLRELVAITVEDHAPLFATRGVHLEMIGDARIPFVGDRTRIAQALGNLLQNAVKFTPQGGRTEVFVAMPGNGLAEVRVRDTGLGIAPEVLGHVFEPFVQSPAREGSSGLGLGLAVVKGVVEQHGGSVLAESDGPGKGATFTIRLPLDAAAAG